MATQTSSCLLSCVLFVGNTITHFQNRLVLIPGLVLFFLLRNIQPNHIFLLLQIPIFCKHASQQSLDSHSLALIKYQKLQRCIEYAKSKLGFSLSDADRISQYTGGDTDAAYRTYLALKSSDVMKELRINKARWI